MTDRWHEKKNSFLGQMINCYQLDKYCYGGGWSQISKKKKKKRKKTREKEETISGLDTRNDVHSWRDSIREFRQP